jgi:acylphosphatase
VEAVFEGPREAVEAVVDWCRRGPALARVDDLVLRWEAPTGRELRFQITR